MEFLQNPLEAGPSRVTLGDDRSVPAGRDEALGPALQVRRRDHDRHYRHRPEEREEEDGAGRPPALPSTRAAGHGPELVGLAGAEGHPDHVLVGLGDEELASVPPYCDRRRAQKRGGCRAVWVGR